MKNNKAKKLVALLLAALIVSSSSALVYAADANNETNTTVNSTEDDIYAFPDEMPTATIPDKLPDGTYEVPVYMYVSNQDEASMGNGALNHTATITMNNGVATAHLTFHGMPFLDAYGHLEKLWIYNSPSADGDGERIEVNADKTEWIVFETQRVKTLVEGSFVMPSVNNVVRCRVQVDAMGDSLQDARLVFDFSSLADYVSSVDFSALEAKIAEAEAIDNSDGKYTSDSYSEMQNSLNYGKTVVTNANATQEEVDMAVEVVQNGIDNLIPCVQDKSALQALVDEANQYNNDDGKYTEDSYSKVQQMLQFANYVLMNDDISLEVYDNVVNALRGAIDGLEEATSGVDTSALEQKIAEAEAIDNSDGKYTSGSYSEMLDSLAYVKTILANTEATQEEIDEAVNILQNGIDNLIPCVQDKSALQALVDEANQYNNDDGKYTEDSFKTLTQMLQFANYVLTNDDISLEVYDNVVNALRNAIDGLVETGSTPVEVDTSVLEQKIAECVTIVNTDGMYTEESYSEFTAALENAKAVLADDNKTQKSVDKAASELQTAKDNLASADFAEYQKRYYTRQISEWLERAESFVGDERFTEESLKTMDDAITAAKAVLADESTPWYELSTPEINLRKSVYGLQYRTPKSFEDGVYVANVKFYERAFDKETSNYSVGNTESPIATQLLGNQIQVTVEGDSLDFTIKGSKSTEYENYYVVSYHFGTEDNITQDYYDIEGQKWGKRDVNGNTLEYMLADSQVSRIADISKRNYLEFNKGEYKEDDRVLIQISLVSKDDTYEEGVGFHAVRKQFLMEIDYDNMIKTGGVEVDKSELADEIDFAEYMFAQGLDEYTETSVAYYSEKLDEAKTVYNNMAATTREVKEAKDNLYSAFQELVKKSAPLTNTAAIDSDTIQLGTSLNVNMGAEGGEGDYTYSVLYKKAYGTKWAVAQKPTTDTAATVKPAAAGQYYVMVKVKDAGGNVAKKCFVVNVENNLKNTSALSADSIKKGESVTVNAAAEGTTGDYQYAVMYKKLSSDKWAGVQKYDANTEITFTPAVATEYEVCVKARDNNGAVAKKYFIVSVTK